MVASEGPPIALDLPALSEPTVSIVICNFNQANYLEAALLSATEQSYPCEVVAVDDGSCDGSRAVLARWAGRVSLVLQDNAGQCGAYNSGFNASTGDVVIFLDADDVLDRDAALRIVGAFSEGVAKLHYRLRLIDGVGHSLGKVIPHSLAEGNVATALMKHGVLYPSAPGSGNAYRRAVLNRLFPLPVDATDRHGADFFTIYGSCLFGEVRAVTDDLGSYRLHVRDAGDSATTALVFGNAARTDDEVLLFRRRTARFRGWVGQRTGNSVVLPGRFLDFSIEKVAFARAVFEAGSYLGGVRDGGGGLGVLLQSLWRRAEYPVSRKVGLTGWALVVLVAPRRIGFPLARFVCNPGERG